MQEEVLPRWATKKEARLVQRILDANERIRKIASQREELFRKLSESALAQPVVTEVKSGDVLETRTFVVSKPKGRYVFFSELDFVTNHAVTKAEQAVLPKKES